MSTRMVAVVNLAVSVLVVLLGAFSYMQADLQGRMAFRQLEDADVINTDALTKFHPDYGFSVDDVAYKNAVPRFIMSPTQRALKLMTFIAAAVCAWNAYMWVFGGQRHIRGSENRTQFE